jgi:Flp pilus assembly protein TadD
MLERADKTDPANLETHLALAAAYPKAHRYEDARRERRLSLE